MGISVFPLCVCMYLELNSASLYLMFLSRDVRGIMPHFLSMNMEFP